MWPIGYFIIFCEESLSVISLIKSDSLTICRLELPWHCHMLVWAATMFAMQKILRTDCLIKPSKITRTWRNPEARFFQEKHRSHMRPQLEHTVKNEPWLWSPFNEGSKDPGFKPIKLQVNLSFNGRWTFNVKLNFYWMILIRVGLLWRADWDSNQESYMFLFYPSVSFCIYFRIFLS